MNILITGDNVDITPEIKELVDEKIDTKLDPHLAHFAPEIKTAALKISRQTKTGNFEVNLDMMLPGKMHVYAKAANSRLDSALIDLREQIERQIEKYKADLRR
ncbi:MAG: ribosome hibernation-promoting factor, HPF/YfiA family [Patescibacteria group bacterium]|jgi:ribosomal subunit interface protein